MAPGADPAAREREPNRPQSEGLPARTAALELLVAVTEQRTPLDEALERAGALARLPARDRAFARLLVATVLRRLPEIDAALAARMTKPLSPKASRTHAALRLGVAQLRFLNTPPHAAVSTAVGLLGGKESGLKALVNAVLRRIAGEGQALAAGDAARRNTPDWLWQSWAAAYGEATAQAIAEAHLADPPLDLTAKGDPAPWAQRLGAQLLPTGTLRLPPGAGDIAKLPGFAEGAWWVQDAAAALPVRLLGPVTGLPVADLCAAPGGKTLQLAAAGAEVTALDLSNRRLALVKENLARTGLSARLVAADLAAWQAPQRFARVLLDAPCSATGTLRRHPDIARLKSPQDVAALAATQARLLAAAAQLVEPGGLLVYAVCSLEAAEGPAVVERFLKTGARFRRQSVTVAELGGLEGLVTPAGDLRSLPCHLAGEGGMDGFYACRLERLA